MRIFSRWMPPAPSRDTSPVLLMFVLAAVILIFVAIAVALPILWGLPVLMIFGTLVSFQSLRKRAANRAGEDIGAFARAFDRRTKAFDPWVVRATWDALLPHVSFPGGRMPLRPTDRIEKDLQIDWEDMDEIFREVAARSGHTLDQQTNNPLYGKVVTVGDFVRYVTFQPGVAVNTCGDPV